MNVKNILLENEALKEENQTFKNKISHLEKIKEGLKLNNGALTIERNKLIEENRELKNRLANVSLWDLSPEAAEEAGHALAKDLLGR